jgi:hypothetical protein
MSFKKRKDPNGGLSMFSKFERQLVLRKNKSKLGEIVSSVGSPISSVEDIIKTYQYYKTNQKIEFPKGTIEQMIEDYKLDNTDKQHLVFHCMKVTGGYMWIGQFISDNQVREMNSTRLLFEQSNN